MITALRQRLFKQIEAVKKIKPIILFCFAMTFPVKELCAQVKMSKAEAEIIAFLEQSHYMDLFIRKTRIVDSLWSAPGHPAMLENIAYTLPGHDKAAFFAAEIINSKGKLSPGAYSHLSVVYANALKNCYTSSFNAWGFPGKAGTPGQRFLLFGDSAISSLALLLDDSTEIYYDGSKTASTYNDAHPRVKDMASWYICLIKGWDYAFDDNPAVRQKNIDLIKEKLKS